MPAGLTVSDLYKEYPTPAEPLVVLGGVSFDVPPGESARDYGSVGLGQEHSALHPRRLGNADAGDRLGQRGQPF